MSSKTDWLTQARAKCPCAWKHNGPMPDGCPREAEHQRTAALLEETWEAFADAALACSPGDEHLPNDGLELWEGEIVALRERGPADAD